ncbi:hypothetical protein BGX26_006801, partial [Mortierella sp. AD094]
MKLPTRHDFFIGMDYLHFFGIGITGLKNPTEDFDTPTSPVLDVPPSIVPLDRPDIELTPEFTEDRRRFLLAIKSELDTNADIPRDSHCPIPEMKIYLTVPPGTIVFRRPRPFAQTDQSLVQETVERWLQDGVIVRAPAGNPHNNPLTLAPKKDLDGNRTMKR